jgi:glutamate-1-semialdehyde 2,1-aminomutase
MTTTRANADLASAVEEAVALFTSANGNSLTLHRRAASSMPGGNTRSVLFHGPFPLYFARGEGARLWDADGHEYVDFVGEYTAGLYGHSNPVIAAAISRALSEGIVMGGHTHHEVALAAAVCARFSPIELVRFCNSGTEANLLAVSAARRFTGRDALLAFSGGYHGSLLSFPYTAPKGGTINSPYPVLLAPYNDADAARRMIADNAARIAAVIVEPMIGGGGCIQATKEFLWALREETEKAGALLIFDEVMTSRLAPGGLQSTYKIRPDLMTLGKYLGGGLASGAFGGRADVMGQFDPRRSDALAHAGTFNNNVLTMAAGHAGLTEVYTHEAADRLNGAGDALRTRLNELARKRDLPVVVTGRGSMMNIHPGIRGPVHSPADIANVPQSLRDLLHLDLISCGIYVARRGMVNLSLPMVGRDFDALAGAFDEFLATRAAVILAACRS